MSSKRYATIGGLFTNRLEFPDGRIVQPVMGGASIYVLSAYLLATDNALLISGVGRDIMNYYGKWFQDNNIDTSGIIYKTDINEYSYVHYNPDGTYECGSTYGPEFRKTSYLNVKLSLDEVEKFFDQIDGLYYGYNQSDIERIIELKKRNNTVIMWEMPTPLAQSGPETVSDYLRAADIWSLNRPESFELFGCNDEAEVIRRISALGKPCFYRVGEKGSYMIGGHKAAFCPALLREDGIDPTGCGNSSTAGALYGFTEGYSLAEIAAWGNTVANFTVRQYGPYPHYDEKVRAEAKEVFAGALENTEVFDI